jgi:hypothetical protein
MAVGSSLSPIANNTSMEHFEKLGLYSAEHKPLLWLWNIHDIFVVWPYGPDRFSHQSSLHIFLLTRSKHPVSDPSYFH